MFEEEGVVGSQDVWGEPVERCMHCFKDFPLSALVEHSRKCTGDMLGSRDRFKGFLPSIHDVSLSMLHYMCVCSGRSNTRNWLFCLETL